MDETPEQYSARKFRESAIYGAKSYLGGLTPPDFGNEPGVTYMGTVEDAAGDRADWLAGREWLVARLDELWIALRREAGYEV